MNDATPEGEIIYEQAPDVPLKTSLTMFEEEKPSSDLSVENRLKNILQDFPDDATRVAALHDLMGVTRTGDLPIIWDVAKEFGLKDEV